MCGIAAIFSYKNSSVSVDREELLKIRDFMTKRGPDGAGEWFSENRRVALGHRRLSIIDLSEEASQPMKSADGKLVISFNGEIYNYRELREELQKKGRIFKSRSDTEVLLHLYAEKGEAMVRELRGMFAFALWDETKKTMFIARDPYGIKPLYYSDNGSCVRIASQVKALLAGNHIPKSLDSAGMVGFFLLGSVPEPFTIYQAIKELPAGHYAWINANGFSNPKSYFSIAEILSKAISERNRLTKDASKEELHEALLDSVRHHFVSDVPVGIFLSSGIDSSSLLALSRECGIQDLTTVTLAFQEFKNTAANEAPLAKMIAEQYQTKHVAYELNEEEFLTDLPAMFEVMDQPTIDGINVYFVSKIARTINLKVALSGLGADELFGGYSSFPILPRLVHNFALSAHFPVIGELFRKLYSCLPPHKMSAKIAGLFKYGSSWGGAYFLKRGLFMPWELSEFLDPDFVREGLNRLSLFSMLNHTLNPDPGDDFARVSTLESSFYMRNQLLRDSDWAGMAHSLEIRTPFADSVFLEKAAPFILRERKPNRKHLIHQSLSEPLPDSITKKNKTGFQVPLNRWLENSEHFNTWKKIPSLAHPNCHWARRWAYVISEHFRQL